MTTERLELNALPLVTAAIVMALLAGGCGEPPVGAPCLPEKVPTDGFNKSESYIESSSVQCETRVCMVYKLRGNPNPDTCIAEAADPCRDPDTQNVCQQRRCAPASEVKDHVYCTCRCKAEAGFAECECPDGFTCEELLEGGGPGVKGSYCVRKGTVSE